MEPHELLGRTHELAIIAAHLTSAEADTTSGRALFVIGVGGIGKSSLLEVAAARHPTLVPLDQTDTLDDRTLFEEALRRPGTLTCIARRQPPSAALRLHPSWLDRGAVLTLDGIDARSAADLLIRRGVPPALAASLAPRFGGHPLTLLLAGEAVARAPSTAWAEALPPLIHEVFELVIGAGDSRPERDLLHLLHVLALLPAADLRALRHFAAEAPELVPGADQLEDAWERLARLPYVRMRPGGLELHDTVRELLVSKLFWGNPPRLARLCQVAVGYTDALRRSGSPRLRAQAFELLEHLNRHHPANHQLFLGGRSQYRWRRAEPADLPQLLAHVGRHEGPRSAAALERWFPHGRFAEVLLELVDGDERLAGFSMPLPSADLAAHPEVEPDPIAEALIAAARMKGAGRRDELVVLRWMFTLDGHHRPSPTLTEVLLRTTRVPLQVWPVYTVAATTEPPVWRDFVVQIGYEVCEPPHVLDGVEHLLMVSLWRGVDTFAWLWTPERWFGPDLPAEAPPPPLGATLYVGPQVAWFGTGSERVDIVGRAALRRILQALVRTHRATPGSFLSQPVLLREGWPNEAPVKSRLHVAVSSLRKLGLEGLIESERGSYRLVPGLRVVDELRWAAGGADARDAADSSKA